MVFKVALAHFCRRNRPLRREFLETTHKQAYACLVLTVRWSWRELPGGYCSAFCVLLTNWPKITLIMKLSSFRYVKIVTISWKKMNFGESESFSIRHPYFFRDKTFKFEGLDSAITKEFEELVKVCYFVELNNSWTYFIYSFLFTALYLK